MTTKKVSYISLLKEAIKEVSEYDTSQFDITTPPIKKVLDYPGQGELETHVNISSILERFYFREQNEELIDRQEEEGGTEAKTPEGKKSVEDEIPSDGTLKEDKEEEDKEDEEEKEGEEDKEVLEAYKIFKEQIEEEKPEEGAEEIAPEEEEEKPEEVKEAKEEEEEEEGPEEEEEDEEEKEVEEAEDLIGQQEKEGGIEAKPKGEPSEDDAEKAIIEKLIAELEDEEVVKEAEETKPEEEEEKPKEEEEKPEEELNVDKEVKEDTPPGTPKSMPEDKLDKDRCGIEECKEALNFFFEDDEVSTEDIVV